MFFGNHLGNTNGTPTYHRFFGTAQRVRAGWSRAVSPAVTVPSGRGIDRPTSEVEADEVESELAWLREAVYGGAWGYLPRGAPPSAFERWRTDPSDLAHPAPVVAGAFSPAAV